MLRSLYAAERAADTRLMMMVMTVVVSVLSIPPSHKEVRGSGGVASLILEPGIS
jgi:hypothetical protein